MGTTSATKSFVVSRGELCLPLGGCIPDPGDSLSPLTVAGPFVAPDPIDAIACALATSSCTVDIAFVPVTPGLSTGSLSVGSGTVNLRGNGIAGTGSGGAGGGVLQGAQASNTFSFGGLKLNKHTGTATLTVEVPGPGDVSLGGSGLVKQRPGATSSKVLPAAGTVKLKIKAKGRKKAKLNKTGKAKVKPKITFSPTGGAPATQTRKVTLRKNV